MYGIFRIVVQRRLSPRHELINLPPYLAGCMMYGIFRIAIQQVHTELWSLLANSSVYYY